MLKTQSNCQRALETVAKTDIDRALELATKDTQKGCYHKIHHASDLLGRIDPDRVRQRCAHCKRLFTLIGQAIAEIRVDYR